jgi:hypothetical protein
MISCCYQNTNQNKPSFDLRCDFKPTPGSQGLNTIRGGFKKVVSFWYHWRDFPQTTHPHRGLRVLSFNLRCYFLPNSARNRRNQMKSRSSAKHCIQSKVRWRQKAVGTITCLLRMRRWRRPMPGYFSGEFKLLVGDSY